MIRANPFTGRLPEIEASAYIDASAVIIGDVKIGARSSVWCNAVLRGDVHSIELGDETNVQDLCVIHVTGGKCGTKLGHRVSIGHAVTLHGCTIEDGALVGIGAIVLDLAVIGRESLVAAGSLVTPATLIPPRSLVMGAPAKVKRPLNDAELAMVLGTPDHYIDYAAKYLAQLAKEST